MKKVMLVEDEEFILEGLCNIIDWAALSMEVVHKAHNGQEALCLFEQEPVDIVVTDVEMPGMDGLDFIKELRRKEKRVRCIILTGYDEFEYARKAVTLDVEEYILKPIDEELLERVLRQSAETLDAWDRKEMNLEDPLGWIRFLEGKLTEQETKKYTELLPPLAEGMRVYPALLHINTQRLPANANAELSQAVQEEGDFLKCLYLKRDEALLLSYYAREKDGGEVLQYYASFQNRLEEKRGIFTFISVGPAMRDYRELQGAYKICTRLQKYRIIDGYGSCINEGQIRSRKSGDVVIDDMVLRKMILQKNKEGALGYVEDLFINNIRDTVDVDVLFQLALKLSLLLQDIKTEYKLGDERKLRDLSDMIGNIYLADDIFGIKTVLISEIVDIIEYLHTDNSQYTPVVKQLMEEVGKNYREDMNLKTLAYKYHMNASYLGQIFQKEVGCSFNQYLNNTKNAIAKDLILNTNMKINDIAREVGYPDTSYFYRKFKQCYGVSPASLRDMKKYDTI